VGAGRILFAPILSATWLAAPAIAQEPSASNRAKIGLALGGGGARGFAHIGVLKWLDEHRVPVYCISGTSAGGLVGGLYASGTSPAGLEQIVSETDWNRVLRTDPEYRDLTRRRKEDRRDYPVKFEFGLRGGFKLPTALNPGHGVGLLLSRATLPYSSLASFDDLPVKFRCVATDLAAGEQVILDRGSLEQALRATMAIPAVFTPVEQGDRVLVDGGLLNNLPVDVARSMGADVVIAVDVGAPVEDRGALKSLFGIIAQSFAVMMEQNVRASRKQADVLVSPDLKGFTGTDYSRGKDLAEIGYRAAERHASAFMPYALTEEEWKSYLAERELRRRTLSGVLAFIEVEGVSPVESERIHSKLANHIGRPFDRRGLEADLTGLTGWGLYDSAAYEAAERDGKTGLRIKVTRKSHGPPFAYTGVTVDGAEADDLLFNARMRLVVADIGAAGSEWRTDLQFGSHTYLGTEFFHRMKRQGWFAAPRIYYDRTNQNLFAKGARVAEYRLGQLGAGVDIGYDYGRQTELRFGFNAISLTQSVRAGNPALPAPDGIVQVAFARLSTDTQDSASIPMTGARMNAEGRWYFTTPGVNQGFGQADLTASAFSRITRTESLFVMAGLGVTSISTAPLQHAYTLGGPLRLTGYARDELRGSRYVHFGAGWLRQIYDLPGLLGQKVYFGGWYEAGSTFERLHDARYRQSLSVGLLADTTLGPVIFGAAWGDAGHSRLFITLGRPF
jgi:NTE family protein